MSQSAVTEAVPMVDDAPEVHGASRTVPAPLFGLTLAWTWIVVGWLRALLLYVAPPGVGPVIWGVLQLVLVAAVVVVPLVFKPIPSLFRRRATVFLVIAGVCELLVTVLTAFGGYRSPSLGPFSLLGLVSAALYTLGWLRLRGRPAATLLLVLLTVALQVLVEFYVGLTYADSVRLMRQFGVTWEPMSAAVAQAILQGASLVPICVPVLLAGLARPVDPKAAPTYLVDQGQSGAAVVYRGTNGLAIASMILGVVGASLPALILGHVARSQIRRTREEGDGLAVAGLVLGYLGVVGGVMVVSYVVVTSMF